MDERGPWERLLAAELHLQQLVQGAVLVGGTAAALHAAHPLSYDGDHVLDDLREHYDEVISTLEAVAGWQTERVKSPVLILAQMYQGSIGDPNRSICDTASVRRQSPACNGPAWRALYGPEKTVVFPQSQAGPVSAVGRCFRGGSNGCRRSRRAEQRLSSSCAAFFVLCVGHGPTSRGYLCQVVPRRRSASEAGRRCRRARKPRRSSGSHCRPLAECREHG